MSTAPKVAIIVLNYNGASCLSACLDSLDRLEYPEKDVIIVDNDSSDGSFATAEAKFRHFTFVRNAKNHGFAKGMNIGIRLALQRGAQWCWLFNYDALATPWSLSALIRAAQGNPRAGLLSPAIYADDGTLWFGKGKIDFFRMRAHHSVPNEQDLIREAYPSEFLTGCAMLIKRELIETIGLLDENYFLYYEDADYSLRASHAGFACLVAPKSRITHSEVSGARPEKIYFLVYSGLIFFKKWAPAWLRPYLSLYVTIRRAKNLFDRVLGNSDAAQEARRAYRDYYGH